MKRMKKRLSVLVLLLLLMVVSVGYAALSSTLTVTGTSTINSATWNVHFANVQTTSGSVSATTSPTVSGTNTTSLTYAVTLTQPGDFYEFTVDVVNGGGINAKLSAVPTLTGVSTAQDVYTNYTVKYSDNTSPAANALLNAGATKTYKVRVEYDRNIEAEQMPTTPQEMTLTFYMNYVQA